MCFEGSLQNDNTQDIGAYQASNHHGMKGERASILTSEEDWNRKE